MRVLFKAGELDCTQEKLHEDEGGDGDPCLCIYRSQA